MQDIQNDKELADTEAGEECCFRRPSHRWRVALVAGVLAAPGAVGGIVVSVFTAWNVWLCGAVGALLGAMLGARIESNPRRPDRGG